MNLFFRTCYLLFEGITPVFVLEGKAPELKHKVIAKRNELQFRGVKPKNVNVESKKTIENSKDGKGRTRFDYVLKQCENLLQCMGLHCVKGPGEAEAFCAFLNKHGLVEGVVSQDSDCFAYGAIQVYRNFSVSSGGNSAGQGGSVDVYDMNKIREAIDLGQNKIIVMGLLCGCDYCPEGIGGIGRDSVIKLFKKYKDSEILARIKSWRENDSVYTALEMKADDKNICSSCGHLGKVQSHTRNGCGSCHSHKGCDSSLWKEERLSIKAELALRQKALADPEFPSQNIIDEFLSEPEFEPELNLKWDQPDLIKFIKVIGHLLQWTEIYCFQKMFPLLTRWQIRNHKYKNRWEKFVIPDFIKKNRVLKGIACYEIVWKDEKGFFDHLIPDEQFEEFKDNNPKGIEHLWSTIEPKEKVEEAYPSLVETFIASKTKKSKVTRKKKNIDPHNMSEMLLVTEEIDKKLKKKQNKLPKGIQMITKFFNPYKTPSKGNQFTDKCSTPKEISFEAELDEDGDDEDFDFSEIINAIVKKPISLLKYNGRNLRYDNVQHMNVSCNKTQDDMVLISMKRNSSIRSLEKSAKKLHLYQSLEDLMIVNECKHNESRNNVPNISSNDNISYFFGNDVNGVDEFEKSVDFSFLRNSKK